MLCSKEIFDDSKYGICEDCYKKIVFTSDFKCCKLCGRPILKVDGYAKCTECHRYGRSFTRGYSCAVYEGVSERIVMDYKYNDKSYLYKVISEIMINKIIEENIDFDYILYTPIHITRRLVRGFNQTELIAKYIGEKTGKKLLDNLLVRKKMTKRLKKLSRTEREEELKSAFECNKDINIFASTVLLIDDIFTTGTTLDSCSEILIESGVADVKIITFAVKCNYDYNIYK
jgi:competence protein ComFC